MTPRIRAAAALLILAALAAPGLAAALEESHVGTHFQVFLPPNAVSYSRANAMVVTAQAGSVNTPCIVDVYDDAADGDSDDSKYGVALVKGESIVIYLKMGGGVNGVGGVNDDIGGKADGDYFVVDASLPVSVMIASDSDWEHDWAPATSGTLRGSEFFLYAQYTGGTNRDIDVFAYENGTHVEIYDVTSGTVVLATTGIAHVGPRLGAPVLSADLNEGEDLNRRYGLGKDLFTPGHVYQVVSTKDVTALYGSIDSVTVVNQARDGAGFVPGRSGHAIDNDFYFAIPHNIGALNEQELRVVAGTATAVATLRGWNVATSAWDVLKTWTLAPYGHADYVGGTYDLYHLTSTGGNVTVYEANWMETGQIGTSDDADFAPGFYNPDGSESFVVYVGPPGTETLTSQAGTFSHVYLFSYAGQTGVWVRDADTNGTLFSQTVDIPAKGYIDVKLTPAQWTAMNVPASGKRPYLRIDSATPIAVCMSNWNDNIMAFATSVLPLNPHVDVVPPPSATVGSTVSMGGTVTNQGSKPLTALETRVTVPTGLTYVDGTLGGQRETAVTSVSGGSEVVYNLTTLAPGASAALAMNVTVTASTGQVASVNVSTTATDSGVRLGQTASAATRPPAAAVATLSNLVAGSSNSVVVLTWEEQAAAGVNSTVIVQRSSATTGPWTELVPARRTSQGSGAAASVSYSDNTAVNANNYYYRIQATGPGGDVSTAGPALGQPRNNTPPPTPLLQLLHGAGSVTATLSGSATPDLRGYLVERASSSSGPWSVITATPVPGPTATFVDANLVNGTVYWYRARAQNTANLYSPYCVAQSEVPGVNATRSSNLVLFYEDMLGSGVNDWDYNDFVIHASITEVVAGGDLAAITIDYEPLARGASYVHAFRQHIPVNGSWTATLTRFAPGSSTQVASRTTSTGLGPVDLEIYADTRDAMPAVSGVFSNTESSQVGYQAGAMSRLELTLNNPGSNPDGQAGAAPWDPYLRMPYLTGPQGNEVHRAYYGGATEVVTSGPLAGTTQDFVIVHPLTGPIPSWSYEGAPVWHAYPRYVPFQQVADPVDADWPDRPSSRRAVFDANH
jgi:LruC domain-containing protein